jgi:beta-lactam-binding protein with PASTA domain
MTGENRKEISMRQGLVRCILLALILAAPHARAKETYLTTFEDAYPAAKQSRIDRCLLCHSSETDRNSYGVAFAGADHKFKSIEALDSDGDGFTNLAEIKAFSFPGNGADKPVGSVQVSLEPQGARTAGAQWRLGTAGAWQDSGARVNGVVVGAQTIQFKTLTGWTAPADQPVNVLSNLVVNFTGTYTPALIIVPNVVGMAQAAATAALTTAGLTVGAITQEYSATIPSGQVITQAPPAGGSAPFGSAVSLKVSKGPQPVTVPNVVGQTQADATTAITAAGLVAGAVTQRHDAAVPDGLVISQTPAAGAPAPPGSAVGLLLSQGPGLVTVPEVTGQTQSAATTVIVSAGLVLGAVTEEFSANIAAGRVVSQTPAANAQADAGTAVALVLSKGPQPVPVPDVAGLTQDAAAAAIAAAGLAVGQVNEAPSDTVPAGTVISQIPAAGALAVPSSPVNLTVSSGPPSAGCACFGGQKGAFTFDGITKALGDLFMIGLALITLRVMAKNR